MILHMRHNTDTKIEFIQCMSNRIKFKEAIALAIAIATTSSSDIRRQKNKFGTCTP